jgi:hypothetical protein
LFIIGRIFFPRPATQEVGKALGGVSKNYLVPIKDEVTKGINESGREKVGTAPDEGGKTINDFGNDMSHPPTRMYRPSSLHHLSNSILPVDATRADELQCLDHIKAEFLIAIESSNQLFVALQAIGSC